MPLRTTARITALSPGQSPPPVRIPTFICCSRYLQSHPGGRGTGAVPWSRRGPEPRPEGKKIDYHVCRVKPRPGAGKLSQNTPGDHIESRQFWRTYTHSLVAHTTAVTPKRHGMRVFAGDAQVNRRESALGTDL